MRYSPGLFSGDVQGGFISALAALPMTVPLGALALAPLGPDYIQAGVVAGFLSSIVAGGVSAILGGNPIQVSGPRASIALLMGGLVATMLAQGAGRDQALVLSLICVFISGGLQVVFGLARFGNAARYVPYPVFSGFVNGVGLVIILGQISSAVGLPATIPWTQIAGHAEAVSAGACAVTLATMAAVRALPRIAPRIPPIIGALGIGIALHHALAATFGAAAVGPVVLLPQTALPVPHVVEEALAMPLAEVLKMLAAASPSILILALVSGMEAVMSSSALDAVTGGRSSANRELIGQGVANAIGACFGSVASTGSPNRGLANFRAGGRTRVAACLHSVFLLALFLWGGRLLALLPYSVLAGVMIMIGWSMTDFWPASVLRKHGRDFLGDFIVTALVAGLITFVNLAFAVFVGLCITGVLFLVRMSRPIVQQRRDRTQVRSRRIRALPDEVALTRRGQEIVVLGLDGPLFFGTSARFRSDLEREAAAARTLILDLRRVREIDVSGVRMLQQAAREIAKAGGAIMLAGLPADDARRAYLLKAGVTAAIPPERILETVDQALEIAEQNVLGPPADPPATPLEAFAVLNGMTARDLEAVRQRIGARRYAPGERIFTSGDRGDGFHLIRSGSVDIVLQAAERQPAIRLATFESGTLFGEMALLSGERRSATAVTRGAVETWFMSNEAFERMREEAPEAATRLLMNMGKELAERLRLANAALQAQT